MGIWVQKNTVFFFSQKMFQIKHKICRRRVHYGSGQSGKSEQLKESWTIKYDLCWTVLKLISMWGQHLEPREAQMSHTAQTITTNKQFLQQNGLSTQDWILPVCNPLPAIRANSCPFCLEPVSWASEKLGLCCRAKLETWLFCSLLPTEAGSLVCFIIYKMEMMTVRASKDS